MLKCSSRPTISSDPAREVWLPTENGAGRSEPRLLPLVLTTRSLQLLGCAELQAETEKRTFELPPTHP